LRSSDEDMPWMPQKAQRRGNFDVRECEPTGKEEAGPSCGEGQFPACDKRDGLLKSQRGQTVLRRY